MQWGRHSGISHYLLQFDPEQTLSENIKCAVLRSGAVLYSEPEFLMRQEFREAAVYNSIVQVIALGATQLNEISQKTMISAQKLSVYIRNLIEVGILERESPVAIGVLNNLEAKGAALGTEIVGAHLFSKSGFTESLIRLNRPDVHLIDCERLYS